MNKHIHQSDVDQRFGVLAQLMRVSSLSFPRENYRNCISIINSFLHIKAFVVDICSPLWFRFLSTLIVLLNFLLFINPFLFYYLFLLSLYFLLSFFINFCRDKIAHSIFIIKVQTQFEQSKMQWTIWSINLILDGMFNSSIEFLRMSSVTHKNYEFV